MKKIITVAPTLMYRQGRVFQRNSYTRLSPKKPLISTNTFKPKLPKIN